MTTDTDNAERTAEGWPIVETERRNDDPWAFDDCWHRGDYWVYRVRGTSVREEERPDDKVGDCWSRFEEKMRAADLTGHAEITGKAVEGLGYRRILSIPTVAELAEWKRIADESRDMSSPDCDGYWD